MNLLRETKRAIKNSGHSPKDIIFIGSTISGHECSWSEFKQLADCEYDSGFGGAEVAQDLTIVFKDLSSLTRGEYDGSEWWGFHPIFTGNEHKLPIYKLCGGSWNSLEEIQELYKRDLTY